MADAGRRRGGGGRRGARRGVVLLGVDWGGRDLGAPPLKGPCAACPSATATPLCAADGRPPSLPAHASGRLPHRLGSDGGGGGWRRRVAARRGCRRGRWDHRGDCAVAAGRGGDAAAEGGAVHGGAGVHGARARPPPAHVWGPVGRGAQPVVWGAAVARRGASEPAAHTRPQRVPFPAPLGWRPRPRCPTPRHPHPLPQVWAACKSAAELCNLLSMSYLQKRACPQRHL
jgi:hypothetical protein